MMRLRKRHHIPKNEGFMKIHNDFTLYWRVFPSGKRVVYYYAYDANDKRQTGRSTGETTMTAARLKCNRLLKAGNLIPNKGYMPTSLCGGGFFYALTLSFSPFSERLQVCPICGA
jgi:hypothetical protein